MYEIVARFKKTHRASAICERPAVGAASRRTAGSTAERGLSEFLIEFIVFGIAGAESTQPPLSRRRVRFTGVVSELAKEL